MTNTRIRIIAVVGPTGIGKTKLGIVLAKALGGEVVSIDSLQVYREAAVMTAQPTKEEMSGVPHHLISYLEADEEPDDYVERALAVIKEMHNRGKVAVLVGGSTSLTEPLLFNSFIKEQRPHTIMLYSELPLHCKRLDDRVDQMVDEGLCDEVKGLYDLEQKLLGRPDFTRGVWKSIGYPELHAWAELAYSGEGTVQLPVTDEYFNEGVYNMKISTRRYAIMQLSWLWSEFIPKVQTNEMDVAILRVTTGKFFNKEVVLPAVSKCCEWLEL